MAYMPMLVPDVWETILNKLFRHKPHNGWLVPHMPIGVQQLCGDMAICFLNCREVCRGFDIYMLSYLGRFTMKPIKALVCDDIELSIEFVQRQFTVPCLVSNFNHVRRILFAEYRFYDRQAIATNRALVRKAVHELPSGILNDDDPNCPYWEDLYMRQLSMQDLPRHNVPWYLPESSVRRFQQQCTQAIYCAPCSRAYALAHPLATVDESLSDHESV